MSRLFSLLGVAVVAALIGPASAGAAISAVPVADTPFGKPSCPEVEGVPCSAITRTIGYQAKVGTNRGLMAVKANGRLVSFTLTLGKPTDDEVKFFEKGFGGAPKASVAVLRRGNKLRARVVATSPPVDLTPYLGKTVEFPLETTIPVEKGWVVGISVPTWAPAFSVGLGSDTSWRASRKKSQCKDFSTQTAFSQGSVPQFYCLYRKEQLTYSARVIPYP
jgi:hypothetical protein